MEQDKTVRKIAMTVWGGRISPVFDSATTLLIVELVDNDIASLTFREFDPDRPQQLVQMLRSKNIMALICGAVSEAPANVLESADFELIPFIAGSVKEVMETYLLSNPVWTKLTMPGFVRNGSCQGRIRSGRKSGGKMARKPRKTKMRKFTERTEKVDYLYKNRADVQRNIPEAIWQIVNNAAKE